jgi:hypothetical protein
MTLPTKKPVWPAEKNLLYEFFGATKNPSGQLRLRTKVDMDGLDLKCKWTLPGNPGRTRSGHLILSIGKLLLFPWVSGFLSP